MQKSITNEKFVFNTILRYNEGNYSMKHMKKAISALLALVMLVVPLTVNASAISSTDEYIFIDRFYLAESIETIAMDLSISVATVYREIEKIKQSLKLHLERNGVFL